MASDELSFPSNIFLILWKDGFFPRMAAAMLISTGSVIGVMWGFGFDGETIYVSGIACAHGAFWAAVLALDWRAEYDDGVSPDEA